MATMDYSQFSRSGVSSSTYTRAIPTELMAAGWGSTYNFEISVTQTRDGKFIGGISKTPIALFNEFSTAKTAPGATFYVDYTNGLDANNGSSGAPFKRMHTALTAANAAAVPTRIVVYGGAYPRGAGFDTGLGALYPTVDLCIEAFGKVVLGNWDEVAGFAADVTHTNTYSKAVANCERVVDLENTNKFGNPEELVNVPTAALCNLTPNSWALVGGVFYIHRADGAAPTNTNIRYFRAAQSITWVTNNHIYLGTDGFDIQGGNTNGPLTIQGTTMASEAIFVAEKCSFRWGGPGSAGVANGVTVNNRRGLNAFFNCRADENAKDGFNVHHSNAGISRILTVNCSGMNNGRKAQSCNGYTLHETVLGLDIAGIYEEGHGGTVHNIGSSVMYALGMSVANDKGDTLYGGGIPPTAIKVGDTARIYAERVVVDQPIDEYAYAATQAGAAIYRKDCAPTRQADYGNGTFGTW